MNDRDFPSERFRLAESLPSSPGIPRDVLDEILEWATKKIGRESKKSAPLSIAPSFLGPLFRHYQGMDFCVFAYILFKHTRIKVLHLKSLEDIPLGLCSFESIPADMLTRLKENTRDVKDILVEKFHLKAKVLELEALKREAESHANYDSDGWQIYKQKKEAYVTQKRKIKKLLISMGIRVRPGSELSQLLRLDNLP